MPYVIRAGAPVPPLVPADSNPVNIQQTGAETGNAIQVISPAAAALFAVTQSGAIVTASGLAVNGVPLPPQPALGAAATDLASALVLVNTLRKALLANGLAKV